MARPILSRLAQGVVVVFVVATLTFVLLHAAPGDPLSVLRADGRIAPEVVEQNIRNYGLDRPIHVQYALYLGRLVRGDLGTSFAARRPVIDAIASTIPNTLVLALAALLIDFGLGIGVGIVQGVRSGGRVDRALSAVTLTLYATPVFWLGLMLLLVFGLRLDWFPVGGVIDPATYPFQSPLGKVLDRAHHLVLPAATLGLVGAGYTARHQRSAMIEAVAQDFVRTARAKGLGERIVVMRHALRNALLPTITIAGLSFPVLLSGAVLVETVFAWPGMGHLAARAIAQRDYPVVTGAAILAAIMVVIGSALADVANHLADPRTRPAT